MSCSRILTSAYATTATDCGIILCASTLSAGCLLVDAFPCFLAAAAADGPAAKKPNLQNISSLLHNVPDFMAP